MHATEKKRTWAVRWLYATVAAHVAVGALMPWIGGLSLFEAYHLGIEGAFWPEGAPAAARAQQVWWIGLFGPTILAMSVWMGVLVHIGDRQRSAWVWFWLLLGLLLWAPQDILISLQADVWAHVWIDGLALLCLVPPLAWLWRTDGQGIATGAAAVGLREPA